MNKNAAIRTLSAALALTSIVATTSGCYFFPKEEEMLDPPLIAVEDITYSTYTAKIKTIISQTIVSGYLQSKTMTNCQFTGETAQIKTIYVRAGDMVEEGDLLAELNCGDLDHLLAIARLEQQRAQLVYNSTGAATDLLTLQIAQNTVEMYQKQYDNSRLYAPCAGQVSFAAAVNAGDYVDPYTTIVTIMDPADMYVKASADNNKTFTMGDDAVVTINDTKFDATITMTPKQAKADGLEDKNAVWAEFKNGIPGFALVGELSEICVTNAIAENVVVIPKHLLKTIDGRTYVNVLVNDEKVEVDVETGISNSTEVEIKSGLSEGDQVIVK